MDTNYRNSLLANIEQFRKLDMAALFAQRYPDQPDLSTIKIGPYTAATFISLSNTLVDSLEAVLNKPLWHTLSANLPHHNEYGSIDSNNMFSNLVVHIAQSNMEAASQNLDRLIFYAMSSGFWQENDQRKQPTKADLKGRSDELDAQRHRLDEALEQYKGMVEELGRSRTGLEEFRNAKVAELDEVRRNMESARATIEELQRLLQNGQATESTLKAIQDGLKESLDKANIELATLSKAYEAFKADSDLQRKGAAEQAADTEQHLKEAEDLYKYIKSKEDEIKRFTGMAADGSMGTKFDARGLELDPWLKFWRYAVPVAAVLSLLWVVAVFLCLRTTDLDPWGNLIVNILKTSPAFVLLGFAMSQYGKERNLREDYAFKAAVAMTITTYADLLSKQDGVENTSRQQLILRALKQVHTPPKLHNEKGGTLFSWRARDLQDSLKNINETLKEAKDTLKP